MTGRSTCALLEEEEEVDEVEEVEEVEEDDDEAAKTTSSAVGAGGGASTFTFDFCSDICIRRRLIKRHKLFYVIVTLLKLYFICYQLVMIVI